MLTKISVNNNRNIVIDCKRLEYVLKKCPNIEEINFGEEEDKYENMDEVMQTITNYCHKLNKICFECKINKLKTETIEAFVQKFGHQIKEVVFPNNYSEVTAIWTLIKNCSHRLTFGFPEELSTIILS